MDLNSDWQALIWFLVFPKWFELAFINKADSCLIFFISCLQIWHNDIILKSIEVHKGAVFSVSKKGKWLLSGGWDKTVNVQVHY